MKSVLPEEPVGNAGGALNQQASQIDLAAERKLG